MTSFYDDQTFASHHITPKSISSRNIFVLLKCMGSPLWTTVYVLKLSMYISSNLLSVRLTSKILFPFEVCWWSTLIQLTWYDSLFDLLSFYYHQNKNSICPLSYTCWRDSSILPGPSFIKTSRKKRLSLQNNELQFPIM
jgi:hypothetical protein